MPDESLVKFAEVELKNEIKTLKHHLRVISDHIKILDGAVESGEIAECGSIIFTVENFVEKANKLSGSLQSLVNMMRIKNRILMDYYSNKPS